MLSSIKPSASCWKANYRVEILLIHNALPGCFTLFNAKIFGFEHHRGLSDKLHLRLQGSVKKVKKAIIKSFEL